MRTRLAVITTHPIQYYAPLFRRLTARSALDLRVYYGWDAGVTTSFDSGFDRPVTWDVPLLDGYDSCFVPNISSDPGTHRFGGIDNPTLIEKVLAWRPDAVLVFGWANRSHLRALRALHGRIPILFRGDSTLLDERPGAKRVLRRAWLTWVYRHVDLALYVGRHNREYFERHGVRDSRLAWAPHAVDNDLFADDTGRCTTEGNEWRRSLGINDEAVAILFAGKLESQKAPELLVDAVRQLDDPLVHVIFAGSGPLATALQMRAANDPRFHFIGFQNQSRMPVVYRLADIFCLPSRSETWGLAVNEAMASGRPIVVSDRVGCAPDLVPAGENGVVVPAGDVRALRESLAQLSGDASRRARMGDASIRIIESWSIDAEARAIEGAALAIAGETSARSDGSLYMNANARVIT